MFSLHVYTLHACLVLRSEVIGSPGILVSKGCEPPYGAGNQTQVPLTTQQSLQTLNSHFLNLADEMMF